MNKHRLYLIGGRSRAGKSTIAQELAEAKSLGLIIKTDYIRAAIRNLIVGEPSLSSNTETFETYPTVRSRPCDGTWVAA
jgi:2-phosphoglycerate kinase